MTATVPFAAELTVRAPVAADLDAVFALVTASDVREFGEPEYVLEEFAGDWQATDLANDARVATLPDGRIVGWATLLDAGMHAKLQAQVYVHPDFEGIGVGSRLIRWTEERAAEHVALAPAGVRVVLHNPCNAFNPKAIALLRAVGYEEVRHFWRMELDLDPDRPTPPPVWPDGIMVRAVEGEADERRLYAAIAEAFRDHWGYVPNTYERWVEPKKRHGFDPGLWLMALDGDDVAGALVGVIYPEQGGWVNNLAVRRPWRRRGLALALLLESFRRFAEREQPQVVLGVDAANPTGATRLYEKAGMRVTREFIFFEKELRAGASPTGEKG